jgi:hypothetical protein
MIGSADVLTTVAVGRHIIVIWVSVFLSLKYDGRYWFRPLVLFYYFIVFIVVVVVAVAVIVLIIYNC